MEGFTPISAAIGGLLIGLSASLFMWLNGRIAGISGIVGGLLLPKSGDAGWRVAFLSGLILGAACGRWLGVAPYDIAVSPSWLLLASGGGLVGVGTAMGSGCTSGHGICGIARRSKRSITATLLFMGVAVLAVSVLR